MEIPHLAAPIVDAGSGHLVPFPVKYFVPEVAILAETFAKFDGMVMGKLA
ncbi:MAG: hypothetical protein JKY00_08945 [Roseicyclus sp.]|nr:hypothetical protein [Roseicyclus sp.]